MGDILGFTRNLVDNSGCPYMQNRSYCVGRWVYDIILKFEAPVLPDDAKGHHRNSGPTGIVMLPPFLDTKTYLDKCKKLQK